MLRGLMRLLLLWVVPIVGRDLSGHVRFFLWRGRKHVVSTGGNAGPVQGVCDAVHLGGGASPGNHRTGQVAGFLRFSDSRKFFEENYARIVQKYNSGAIDSQVGELKDNVRIEAMRFLARTPPLNGQFVIVEADPARRLPLRRCRGGHIASQVFDLVAEARAQPYGA
jgi:hypothetical protein